MTEITDAAWIWLAKGVGAVAGSAISLAYILPHGRREAALRFAVGTVCGLVFGGAVGLKIAAELGIGGKIGAAETVLMGAAAASLSAWWALGFVFRAFERGGAGRQFWQQHGEDSDGR
jgi:hypothetical protein